MVRATASSWLAVALAATVSVSVGRAEAADASPADRALAQSLFDDGRKLMDEKDYASACPRFAESQRLDPGGGTILNLALCHEAEGKTASAWTEFNEALSRAIRDGRPEREARARERIAVLEPKLSRLTVSVAAGAPADLELMVDGAPWGAELRGAGVPLDPGPHFLVARSAGRSPWSTTVILGSSADTKTVVVPPHLENLTSTAGPESSGFRDTTARSGGRRAAGWIVGGAGVAALGVGAFSGVLALSKRSDSNAYCTPSCTMHGVNLNNEAITAAWVSDFGVGLGVVGVAAGVYLLLTARRDTPPQAMASGVRVLPEASPRGAGAALLVGW